MLNRHVVDINLKYLRILYISLTVDEDVELDIAVDDTNENIEPNIEPKTAKPERNNHTAKVDTLQSIVTPLVQNMFVGKITTFLF